MMAAHTMRARSRGKKHEPRHVDVERR